MIIVLGLIILIAAVVVGVAGLLTNHGSAHTLVHGFSLFGYHVTGSGTLFLDGIVVGAVAVFGLSLVFTGARRTSRRGSEARRGLVQSQNETVALREDRDELIGQREATRDETATVLINGSTPLIEQREATRDETATVLIKSSPADDQREATRDETATVLIKSSPPDDGPLNPVDGPPSRRHRVGRREAARQEATTASANGWTGQRGV